MKTVSYEYINPVLILTLYEFRCVNKLYGHIRVINKNETVKRLILSKFSRGKEVEKKNVRNQRSLGRRRP